MYYEIHVIQFSVISYETNVENLHLKKITLRLTVAAFACIETRVPDACGTPDRGLVPRLCTRRRTRVQARFARASGRARGRHELCVVRCPNQKLDIDLRIPRVLIQ